MPFLPLELCLHICEYLDSRGLKRAHLISRNFASAAEPRLFETFHLRCNLDRFKKLREISSHDRIRYFVKKIHYETRLYEDCSSQFWCTLPSVAVLSADEQDDSYCKYEAYLKEQAQMNSRNIQVDRLSKAIKNFPNFTTLCLDNSATVVARPPPCLERFYGDRLESLQPRANPRRYTVDKFATMSIAAKSVLPHGIQELRLAGHGLDFLHDIDLPDVVLDPVWDFLSKLQSLEIDLVQYLSKRTSKLTHIEFCTFTEILRRTEGLRRLNLSSSYFPELFMSTKEILRMLEPPSSAFIDRVMPRQLPWALTHLKLGEVTVSNEKLLGILAHMSHTLQSLQLFDIGLTEKAHADLNTLAVLTTNSWIFLIRFLAEKLHLTHIDFGGFLTNLQTESWRVSTSPSTARSELARDLQTLSMKERVTNYVVRKGVSPFTRKIGAAGDVEQWSEDEINAFNSCRGQELLDGGKRFLLWNFEEDESWWFDCDAWANYTNPPVRTI